METNLNKPNTRTRKEILLEKLRHRGYQISSICDSIENSKGYPDQKRRLDENNWRHREDRNKLASFLDYCWDLTNNRIFFDAPVDNPRAIDRLLHEIPSRTLTRETFEAYLKNAIFVYEHIRPENRAYLDRWYPEGFACLKEILAEHHATPYSCKEDNSKEI
jgi:hypothetical protein